MFQNKINSVAIFDLFHRILMNFQLYRINSFNYIPNFKNILISIRYSCRAIDKSFDTIILKFHSGLLFFEIIFFHLFRIFKNLSETKNNVIGGGGEIAMVLTL